MNIKQLMKQAQQMQDQMQQKIATIRVEGSAGDTRNRSYWARSSKIDVSLS